jgi:deoxyadenosine/deoxycytidine kinase
MKDYENSFGKRPDIYIYIETDPSICAQRINLRNRESEDKISIDYLSNIHTLYTDMYNNISNDKCFKINGNDTADLVFNKSIDIINNLL